MNITLLPLGILSALAAVCTTGSALAVLAPIGTRAALGVNPNSVDWTTLGVEFTTPANPFAISSAGGLSLNVSKGSVGNFERVDESGFGWTGNFAVGDGLLWTSLTPGPITIDFGASILGAGVQIQNDFLGAFTATLEAFDASNVSLGSFNFNGSSTQAQDNSAIFVGVLNTTANVRRITLDIAGSSSFAINRVSISAASVPEPGTALGGLVCLALAGSRRSRHRQQAVAR